MHPSKIDRGADSPAAVGIVVVAIGIAALALRQAGADVGELVDGAGWPFFVIVPGLALLVIAVMVARPQGHGFAIAGSIVTTIGLILLYQESTGNWESWAYVWTLIPGAAGLAMILYGSALRRRDLVAAGLRLGAVAGALFVAGFWFFETTFETGRAPIDLGQWWPAAVIGLGLLIALSSVGQAQRPRNHS
jgi:hypothetical protein